MIENNYCYVSLHCVYIIISENINYLFANLIGQLLKKTPDKFIKLTNIIRYYIGYSNGKFAIRV